MPSFDFDIPDSREDPHMGQPLHEKSSAETGLQNQPKTGSTPHANHGSGTYLSQAPDVSSAS